MFKTHFNHNNKHDCSQEIKATIDSGYFLKVGICIKHLSGELVDSLSGMCSHPMGSLKSPFLQFCELF